MPSIRLTDARIKALKPTQNTRNVRDANLRGFGLRILPSGRKRYFIHTQFNGQRIWKLIGDANQTSLADAREAARAVLAAVRKGLPAVASADETRFETIAEEAFRSQSRRWKPSTLKVNRWYLNNQILPWFRGRQIADITRKDVQNWFMSLHATPVAADRSAPVLSVIMAQAEVFGYRPTGTNPCRGIQGAGRERQGVRGRDASLSEVETRCRAKRRGVPGHPLRQGTLRPASCQGSRAGEAAARDGGGGLGRDQARRAGPQEGRGGVQGADGTRACNQAARAGTGTDPRPVALHGRRDRHRAVGDSPARAGQVASPCRCRRVSRRAAPVIERPADCCSPTNEARAHPRLDWQRSG
ncbi:MAG: DUF4102 domain-containing protein [Boseongicola sp. SB0677_bin_26]|nr:DUF4102 domain-containing protein [Boseongicola sp. SB0665_bin_10]MYG28276.1 DUF4102 domain-containing protein [Boseongicola sp. SB0677_bin_26]